MEKNVFFLLLVAFFLPAFLFAAQIEATNIEYSLYKKERLEWTFRAKYFSQENPEFFYGESVLITNPYKGLKIKGDRAFYYKKEDKFVIKGRVKLFTRKKGELFTSELIFFPKKNLVIGYRKVILKQKGAILKGRGFVYRLDRHELKLKSRTKAIFSM